MTVAHESCFLLAEILARSRRRHDERCPAVEGVPNFDAPLIAQLSPSVRSTPALSSDDVLCRWRARPTCIPPKYLCVSLTQRSHRLVQCMCATGIMAVSAPPPVMWRTWRRTVNQSMHRDCHYMLRLTAAFESDFNPSTAWRRAALTPSSDTMRSTENATEFKEPLG